MPTHDSETGRRLTKEIKRHGLARVLDAFRWLSEGEAWHAQSQRATITTKMMTALRHVESWSENWEIAGNQPDEKPKQGVQTIAQRIGFGV